MLQEKGQIMDTMGLMATSHKTVAFTHAGAHPGQLGQQVRGKAGEKVLQAGAHREKQDWQGALAACLLAPAHRMRAVSTLTEF